MRLTKEVDKLRKGVLELATIVEETVRKAVVALETDDAQLAQSIIDGDSAIDQAEVDLEEECLKVLALHQPVAIDLRYIVAILKINNDLERVADLSVNIARRVRSLAGSGHVKTSADLPPMAEKVRSMLRRSLDALVDFDAGLAREVMAMDDQVDVMHKRTFDKMKDLVREDPEHADTYMQFITISRNLERMADLATNIAEDVIYLINGEIVRHQHSATGY